MSVPIIKLKPQRPERIGHPWIFDNEIAVGPPPDFTPGNPVRVVDSQGRVLGVGYANLRSKIAIRFLTYEPNREIDADFWRGRLEAALAYRKARYPAGLPLAYRLSHGEADGLPGLIADVYPGYAVVQIMAQGLEPWRDVIVESLMRLLSLRGIYERSDSSVRKLEGLDIRVGVMAGDEPPEILEWKDDGITILADLVHGAKTGLFLDQRENQRAAAREAQGREVLNCFAYTGLFGLRAAQSGAATVTEIEISKEFCALNERQWSQNGFETPHAVQAENVFDVLRSLDAKRFLTDMVVLDPPAFTKNRASREAAARGYNEINRLALKMIRPGGVLVTCSCSHHISADEFRQIVQSSARDANRRLRIIERRGPPADHPVLIVAPESEYLKCLILAVE